jgi:uncharacterized membrane protein YphA (DoxX/SURF4 family)
VLAIVLLRLAIGWHFIAEGLAKLGPAGFSAEPFLLQAKGPLAPYFHDQVPGFHRWRELLAKPRADVPWTDEERAKLAAWETGQKEKAEAAKREGEPPPVELPPIAAYQPWGNEIAGNWRQLAERFKDVAQLSESEAENVDDILRTQLGELANYLAENEDAIIEYRHELARLATLSDSPAANELPYLDERIAWKTSETRGPPNAWIADIRMFETTYVENLTELLESKTDLSEEGRQAATAALAGDNRLGLINKLVTGVVLGVGILLVAGFFTRIASLVGGLFLLSVVLTQPPWIPGTEPVYYQVVELMGLGVLLATGAGRWAGLDFFTYSFWGKCCASDGNGSGTPPSRPATTA